MGNYGWGLNGLKLIWDIDGNSGGNWSLIATERLPINSIIHYLTCLKFLQIILRQLIQYKLTKQKN